MRRLLWVVVAAVIAAIAGSCMWLGLSFQPPKGPTSSCDAWQGELPPTLLSYGYPPREFPPPELHGAPDCRKWNFTHRERPAIILDGFIFNGEYDVLLWRLYEGALYVDRFILLETNSTFTLFPKPRYYERRQSLYSRWHSQIMPVQLTVPSDLKPGWPVESWQRDSLIHGFEAAVRSISTAAEGRQIFVLFGDVDEIPSARAMQIVKYCNVPSPVVLTLDYWGNYAFRWKKNAGPWKSQPHIIAYEDLQRGTFGKTIDEMRLHLRTLPSPPPWDAAGYHLSFFMCPLQVQAKLRAYSHQEFNVPQISNIKHLERCFQNGLDFLVPPRPWEHNSPYDTQAPNATLPWIVKYPENRRYFSRYL